MYVSAIIKSKKHSRKITELIVGVLLIVMSGFIMSLYNEIFSKDVSFCKDCSWGFLLFVFEVFILSLLILFGPITKVNIEGYTMDEYNKELDKDIDKI